jgi:hypothetical protein
MARNNLIVNPSFKTNTTGWSATGSSTLSRITTDYFYGSSSLQVAKAASANSGAVTSSRILVTQALSYALGVIRKDRGVTEDAGTLVGRVQWYDSATAGSLLSTSNTISLDVIPGDDWVRLTGVFTAPAGALSALVSVVQPTAGTAAETFYVDAVLFEQASYLNEYVDEPTQAQETKEGRQGSITSSISKDHGTKT